jgi:hypothetical protein
MDWVRRADTWAERVELLWDVEAIALSKVTEGKAVFADSVAIDSRRRGLGAFGWPSCPVLCLTASGREERFAAAVELDWAFPITNLYIKMNIWR